MKKLVNPIPTYPFSMLDPPGFFCKCGSFLRHAAIHERYYEVSQMNQNEILKHRKHICVKDKAKK